MVGRIYEYNDKTHTVGIQWKNYSTYNPIIRFVIDGTSSHDVVPNNPGTDNYKIINMYTTVSNGSFQMNFTIYIDGVYYNKYVKLT